MVLCTLLITGWLIWYAYVHARQDIDQYNRLLASHLSLQIDNTLKSLWQLTDPTLKNGELADMINGPEEALHRRMVELHHSVPSVLRFMVYNNRGVLVGSSHELPARRVVINDREYFRFLQNNRSDQIYVGRQTAIRYDTLPVIPIGRRIETANSGFAGVLSAPLDYRFLQGWLDSLKLPNNFVLMLVRTDGEMLVRYPMLYSPPQDSTQINAVKLLEHHPVGQPYLFNDQLKPGELKLFGVIQQLEHSNLIAIVGVEQSAALAEWRDLANGYALLGLTILLGLLFVWWWLGRHFTALAETEFRWQRAQAIIDASPDMVFALDSNGRFQYVNDTASQRLGYTGRTLTGSNLTDIAPNLPLITYIQHYQHLRADYTRNIESQLRCASGEILPVEISTKLMSMQESELMIAFARDVTQRKDAERELARLTERWQMLTVSVCIGIAEWDVSHNLLDCDPIMVEIYGFPSQQVSVDGWIASIHPEDRPRIQAEMDTIQRMGGTIDTEFRIVRQDGVIRYIRGYMLMERNSDGTPRIVGLNIDITDRRRAEAMVQTVLRVTSTSVGEHFFRTLVVELARALNIRYAVIGSYSSDKGNYRMTHTLARAERTRLLPNIEYQVQGTPSELAIDQKVCVYADQVQTRFPTDFRLAEMNIQSLVSVSLRNGRGDVIGSLAIMDDKPISDPSQATTLLTIIATRTAAELERLQAEATLKQEQRYIERVLLYSPAIICSMSTDGLIRRINQAYQVITGNVPQDAIGRTWRDVFASDIDENLVGQFLKRGSGEMEHTIFSRSGEARMLIWKTTGPRTGEGDAADIIAVGVDVTMRRSAEAEIRKLNAELEKRVAQRTEQLQASMRELESFSYSVSHDLRAPLRSIGGFSTILQEDYADKLDENGQDYLRRIVNSAGRMSHLIDDMLNLSRISRQRLNVHEIDLAPIANQIISDLRFAEPDRRVHWICPSTLTANADERLIHIVLENLLRNAWKFSAKHDEATIEFNVYEDFGKRVYYVKDDGAGFDMRNAARLFGAFQRLHDASEFEGTGIGLAIVQRVIHRHGGSVWAEGEMDKGAKISFTLPPPDPSQPTDIEFENRSDDDEAS
ncbi:PAS domain S-box-containing protein [Chitinivorax tropicus]|uniref:histidine kinase n=1 Tax=Chitinivorax tropicus TaxID=714531 RepID=A0A840MP57_9PROT|nr:PAS domain S-box protein [Chitinivorax tropicus]MBB5017031.1 PAS domain S-box-containing protein [Chitinivorax tropicus]